MSKTLLTIADVSEILGVSTSTTRRLVKTRVLPAIRVGGGIRIDRDLLRAWLSSGGGGVRKNLMEVGLTTASLNEGGR